MSGRTTYVRGRNKMAKSRTQLRNEVKAYYINALMSFLSENGEECLRTKDAEFCFPVTDAEGNEDFVKITVAIPTGANKGMDPYDGYGEAEDYQMKLELKAEKAKAAAEAKAKKIARDEAYRAKKAEQVANR